MEDVFITDIHINKVRHLENIDIHLSDTERKHLILTGKNGSGKTSVLESLEVFLSYVKKLGFNFTSDSLKYKLEPYKEQLQSGAGFGISGSMIYNIYQNYQSATVSKSLDAKFNYLPNPSQFEIIDPIRGILNIPTSFFVVAYFDSYRKSSFDTSEGPQKFEIEMKNLHSSSDFSKFFIKYLVNNRYERLNAIDIGDEKLSVEINNWFSTIQNLFKELFNDKELELVYDHDTYDFKIKQVDRELYSLNEMPSGYSAIIRIISDLLIRLSNSTTLYQTQGIVLIDEIETHLHIDLQKKILPFLTKFFPKIQFIVTTHSPFVLTSIDNAVIFDLEKQERIEDLSGYSLEGVVRGYFGADEYSIKLKEQIQEYEKLLKKGSLSIDEQNKLNHLRFHFKELPKFLAPELQVKLQQLELEELTQ